MFESNSNLYCVCFTYNGVKVEKHALALEPLHALNMVLRHFLSQESELSNISIHSITIVDDVLTL